MARNYDRLIRFYDSWFADLTDQEKGFTSDEQLAVIMAIRECQRVGCTLPLDELPREIKRGLQMATLKEQITRIIDRVEGAKARGRAAAAARYSMEDRDKERQEREKATEEARKGAVTREEYLRLKKLAESGDEEAKKALGM